LQFLKNSIRTWIDWFEKARKSNRSKSFISNIAISVISIILSVILGLDYNMNSKWLTIISIILSIIVAILSVSTNFMKYKELWVRYTMVCNKLYGLQHDLEYELKGRENRPMTIEEIGPYQERYNSIMDEGNIKWEKLRG